MTPWSKTPPSEPGWYWCRLDGFGLWPVHVRDDRSVAPNVQDWPGGDAAEYGPRIPSPEAIEAAKDALREAIPHLSDACSGTCPTLVKCCAAIAKLEGRS